MAASRGRSINQVESLASSQDDQNDARGRCRMPKCRSGFVDVDGCFYKKGWNHKVSSCACHNNLLGVLTVICLLSTGVPLAFALCKLCPSALKFLLRHTSPTCSPHISLETWLMQDGSLPTCVPSVQRSSSLAFPFLQAYQGCCLALYRYLCPPIC